MGTTDRYYHKGRDWSVRVNGVWLPVPGFIGRWMWGNPAVKLCKGWSLKVWAIREVLKR